ncbi:hypothetical protein [Fibrobacter sp. UWEL]|uniref:hypothetical protein n=1 Tax=Fibrobacter sp. UWEL TaxID=1896209 RepID=UPI000922FA53|nr:hypothetical protein [Fibrobacter sp. UWEL]SHK76704.1 hypothetical protein SAMN05720468_106126 [Fibrobacter sp. UWEL]
MTPVKIAKVKGVSMTLTKSTPCNKADIYGQFLGKSTGGVRVDDLRNILIEDLASSSVMVEGKANHNCKIYALAVQYDVGSSNQ